MSVMPANSRPHQTGFAILYVVLVVAGVILLFTTALAVFSPQSRLAKTMDQQRQTDLNTFQHALEEYAANHNGQYPATTTSASQFSDINNHQPQCYNCGLAEYQQNIITDVPFTKDDWIPGLVEQGYLPTLPTDPQNGQTTAGLCSSADWPRGYIYFSDGQNYKLIDFCGPTSHLNFSVSQDSPYCVGENGRILIQDPSGNPALDKLVDPKQPGFHYAIYSPAWACL